ncbi:cell envelope integrity protein TolA, partial [Rosenbergiella nectarea]
EAKAKAAQEAKAQAAAEAKAKAAAEAKAKADAKAKAAAEAKAAKAKAAKSDAALDDLLGGLSSGKNAPKSAERGGASGEGNQKKAGASGAAIQSYLGQVQSAIQSKFYDADNYAGKQCSVHIKLAPDGLLISATSAGGDPALCQAALTASRLAHIPKPPSQEVWAAVKEATITFKPGQ